MKKCGLHKRFNIDYSLTPAKNISQPDIIMVQEIQTFTTYFNQTFTLDFYGDALKRKFVVFKK